MPKLENLNIPLGVGYDFNIGVFAFTGDEYSMGGASIGLDLSSGIGVATSFSLDGEVMTMTGGGVSLGAGVQAGTTYHVQSDDRTIYRSGSIGSENIFYAAAGDAYESAVYTAIDTGSVLNGEGGRYTSIITEMPDGVFLHRTFTTYELSQGHATLCGDGAFTEQHVPIVDILCTDVALVRSL